MPLADALADVNGTDPRLTQQQREEILRRRQAQAQTTEPRVQVDIRDLQLFVQIGQLLLLAYIAYQLAG